MTPPWWINNLIFVAAGLIMAGLGVYDKDNQALILAGVATVSASLGHAYGKVSPTP